MRTRFDAKDPRSWMLRFHTQTAGSTLTAQQTENNIVRVALQALAAVLGGTQSLHTNSKDEALALPSEDSVRTALRTQQIIACESGVADSIDPLAGSYLLESLTKQIEDAAMEYVERIMDLGGPVAAIEHGYMQREILEAAYRYQREIELNQRLVVGVNVFTSTGERPSGLLRFNASVEESQRTRLAALRAARNAAAVEGALAELRTGATGDANLMPLIIAAVRAEATLGEICGVLRDVFGEYRAPSMV
jgi:methylmalonyl-CoA mutase N-terminal domain/subunit